MQLQWRSPAPTRKPYPSDVSDEAWAFVAPYLTLCRLDAKQRTHDVREVFNALRWMVRTGAQWRMMPNHFPPWSAVYQQTQRWIRAGVFDAMVHDLRELRELRELLRLASGRSPTPTAVIMDAQTLQSTPESGHRAGYAGQKKNGSEAPRRRRHPGPSPHATRDTSQCAGASAGSGALGRGTGDNERRWVVERRFAWKTRFRRLVRDFERLPETVAGLHFLAFACLMLSKTIKLFISP